MWLFKSNKKLGTFHTKSYLPMGVQRILFVLTGDDAFGLKTHMMKAYPQQNLTTKNYRHSRGKTILEKLFDIMTNRWWIYNSIMLLESTALESVILATLALHNILVTIFAKNIYCPTIELCDKGDLEI